MYVLLIILRVKVVHQANQAQMGHKAHRELLGFKDRQVLWVNQDPKGDQENKDNLEYLAVQVTKDL